MIKERFAAMNMVYQKYSFDYFLDSMERLGLRNFELWAGAPHLFCMNPSLADVKEIKRKVKQRKMKMVCLTPEQVMYPYNIAAADWELRRDSIEYFQRYIQNAAELEIDKVLCCAGWGNYDEDFEEAWKRSRDSLEMMTRFAERENVKLAFEILGPQESNLVHDFEATRRMMSEIESPYFTLCVDTVPVYVEGKTLDEYFTAFGNRISHFHLTDGNPAGHVPCGTGIHPIESYLGDLERFGYEGYITLEIGDTSCCVSPESATRTGFETIKKYMG